MTRINVIAPSELCDQHLLAEHRELTRIPNCVNAGLYKPTNIPATYVLGTGHVKFFTNKLKWLRSRYNELHEECLKRGFGVTYKFPDSTPDNCQGDYVVTAEAVKINLERIALRMPVKARWYGKMLKGEQNCVIA